MTATAPRYTIKPAANGLWQVFDGDAPANEPESLRLAKSRARNMNKEAAKP